MSHDAVECLAPSLCSDETRRVTEKCQWLDDSVSWVGHECFVIVAKDFELLFDPGNISVAWRLDIDDTLRFSEEEQQLGDNGVRSNPALDYLRSGVGPEYRSALVQELGEDGVGSVWLRRDVH